MLQPVRLLLIAPSLQIVGGQGVQADRLLRNLHREPCLRVRFLPINPPFPRFLGWVRRVPLVRTVLNFFIFSRLLLCSVPACDVLHVFAASYWSFLLWATPAILVGRIFAKGIVLNYHDGRADDHLSNWHTAIPILKLAHRIAVPSNYLVTIFARHGLHVQSIYNILEPGLFRYRERLSFRPAFLTNRGLEKLYNVGCVLRAFAIIQRRLPDATLTVAHDGPCREELQELARLLGLAHVNFVGCVSQSRMAELYDEADLYLMSPEIDNMPLTVLECWASGVPVISTDAGGVPFIVRHRQTGILVPRNDHVALARAALEPIENPELGWSLATQGRQECLKYTWDATRHAWLELYADLRQS